LDTKQVTQYLGYRTEKTFLNAMYAGRWERPEKADPHDPNSRNVWRAALVLVMQRRGPLPVGTTTPPETDESRARKARMAKPRRSGAKRARRVNWIIAGTPGDYEA
jgi:hypothetical protein